LISPGSITACCWRCSGPTEPPELEDIAQVASEFLVEALAMFEMTQRGFTELLSTDRPGGTPTEGGSPDVMPDR
jgi:hypothetical protein